MAIEKKNALRAIADAGTILIADTADFQLIERFKPSEGTTNPSLLYAAAQQPQYQEFLDKTSAYIKTIKASEAERLDLASEYLAVLFGVEIHKRTGRVSTEVNVCLSFDTQRTVDAGLRVIDLYAQHGVPKEGVRIKISATWEGIQAARILEQSHGISCLVTIVFGMVQAITAAEAGVTCIAPYVGRISDWHKLHGHTGEQDKGVEKVIEMQNYLRKYGHKTQVMAASFRNTQQAKSLAGTDLLTISPAILEQLEADWTETPAKVTPETAASADLQRVTYIDDEPAFRWAFNADACAVEKSADAMRRFADDAEHVNNLLRKLIDV